jgi:hypothetical protein
MIIIKIIQKMKNTLIILLGMTMLTTSCHGLDEYPIKISNDLTITSTKAMSTPYAGVGTQWGGYDEIKNFVGTDSLSNNDWQKLFSRVEFMRPGLIRIMASQGWNYMVSGSYNPQKSSKILFKILDFCQAKNINVIYGEWGENALSNNQVDSLWLDRSVNFLDYLINTKNYSCIKYLNICNEPAGSWSSIKGDYILWKNTYQALNRRLNTKGLKSKIKIMAPDISIGNDLNVSSWITNSKSDFDSIIGSYDIHAYPTEERVKEGGFLTQLESYRTLAPANKDFIIGELGYKYGATTDLGIENAKRIAADPHASDDSNMLGYDAFYGIDMANVVIQSIYAGCNGIVLWNMDDAMYSDNLDKQKLKRWGFWNILGEEMSGSAGTADEAIRPWFYPMSLLCRYIPAGSTIYKVTLPTKKGVEAIAAVKDGKYTIVVANTNNVSYSVNLKMETGLMLTNSKCYSYVSSPSGPTYIGTIDTNGFPTPYATKNIDLTNGKSFPISVNALSFTLITTME